MKTLRLGLRLRPGLRLSLGLRPGFGLRPALALGLAIMAIMAIMGTAPAFAAPTPIPTDGWTQERAAAVIAEAELAPTVRALGDLTLAGDEAGVLELLEYTRTRSDWPAPARDAAVFEFTRSLARLPADAVPAPVLRYLETFEAQTRVPHHDHPAQSVPLLNVRAAAQGLEHRWLRQEALLEGQALITLSDGGLVDAFLIENHPAVRAGYLDALSQASSQRAGDVAMAAAKRLTDTPELTRLAGHAALRAGDANALVQVTKDGGGPGFYRVLAIAAAEQPDAAMTLLAAALGAGEAETAALAMAQLYPVLAGLPDADAALLARLGDDALGSAAALALSRSPSLDTQLALEALAATPDRPAARRAQLALDLRTELDQGPLP